MSLSKLLFKPKWQDKNPAVRRACVAHDADAELLAALPAILREDADAGVRLAALKRLDDYEIWRVRSTADADAPLRHAAREAYLDRFCAGGAKAPAIERRIDELATLSAAEIERAATTATEADLRAAALARVTRPALLAERAIGDADARLRLAALERVNDTAALERIAEQARKTDKAIARRAKERLEARRIDMGDEAALARKARTLCERAEALLRAHEDDATLDALAREWQTLGERAPTELAARFANAQALVRRARELARNPPPPAPPVEIPPEPAAPLPPDPQILAEAARANLDAQREREHRKQLLRDIEKLLPDYTGALDAGAISAAHAPHARLAELAKLAAPLPPALADKLAPLHERYAQLKSQQAWAHGQRRRDLCGDIERLAKSNPHPDALALRVREAREEWRRLDAAEGLDADSPASGLARRFHAVCHQALKPARAYFAKREAVRGAHAEEIEKHLQAFAALPEPIEDWQAAHALRRELGQALRALDGIEPKRRTELSRRLKSAIASLEPRLDAHLQKVEKAKQRLIEQAAALSPPTDGHALAREARELQEQWKSLGQGRRNRDLRQWQAFRGALDSAFGKLDAARQERDAQREAERAERKAHEAAIEAARRAKRQTRLDEFAQALAAHRDQPASGEANEDAARDLLVEIESFAELDTPAEDRPRRKAWQMRQLATILRDRTVMEKDIRTKRLLDDWFALPPQTASLETRFEHAARAMLDALP